MLEFLFYLTRVRTTITAIAIKLVFSAKACCKVVLRRSTKNPEPKHFHSNPYYEILPYLMIISRTYLVKL